MIKEEIKKVESTQYIHHFYCDRCGEEIGASVECDDGYVPTPKGVHEVEPDGLYVRLDDYYDKIYTPYSELCDTCWRELRENSIEAIEKIFSEPAK